MACRSQHASCKCYWALAPHCHARACSNRWAAVYCTHHLHSYLKLIDACTLMHVRCKTHVLAATPASAVHSARQFLQSAMVLNSMQTVGCLRRNACCLSACRTCSPCCCRVANTACGCHKGAVHRSRSSDGPAPPLAATVPVAACILDANEYAFCLFGATRMCSQRMLECQVLNVCVEVVLAVLDTASIGAHHIHTHDDVLPHRCQQ